MTNENTKKNRKEVCQQIKHRVILKECKDSLHLMKMEKSRVWSISQLSQLVEWVFYENFDEFLFWCKAEVWTVKQYGKRWYIDLVESGEWWTIKAKITWIDRKGSIFKNFLATTKNTPESLKWQEVMVQGYFTFSVKWWLSISIVWFSKEYTKWKQLEDREKTLQILKERKLYNKNRSLWLTKTPLKLAIVSSKQSEWLRDFQTLLDESWFAFDTTIFWSPVEGNPAIQGVVDAFSRIEQELEQWAWFDAILLVRGWGWQEWFAWQNSFDVCRVVAEARLPVVVAIGHTADSSLLDQIAWMAKKTPSDAAWFFISRIQQYTESVDTLYESLCSLYKTKLQDYERTVDTLYDLIQSYNPKNILRKWYAYLMADWEPLQRADIDWLASWEEITVQTYTKQFRVRIDWVDDISLESQ